MDILCWIFAFKLLVLLACFLFSILHIRPVLFGASLTYGYCRLLHISDCKWCLVSLSLAFFAHFLLYLFVCHIRCTTKYFEFILCMCVGCCVCVYATRVQDHKCIFPFFLFRIFSFGLLFEFSCSLLGFRFISFCFLWAFMHSIAYRTALTVCLCMLYVIICNNACVCVCVHKCKNFHNK